MGKGVVLSRGVTLTARDHGDRRVSVCVRVPRSVGEETRKRLAEAGILDHNREIIAEDGDLYLPVTDSSRVPADLTVVDRHLPPRETVDDPGDLLDEDPSYERLGDIVILDEDDPDRASRIAEAVMQSDLPAKTVVNRASKILGTERLRDWTVLAGNGTETIHREHGHAFAVDIREVYFSPRLATERHRVVSQINSEEQVFDMFAGVGPFVIPAASRGATAVGVDINSAAVSYLRENAERNGVTDRVTAIEDDVRNVAEDWAGWADRLIMNLPHSADSFLETAMNLAGNTCTLHFYDIQPESDPYGPGEQAIRMAAGNEYDVTVIKKRDVRSYAPHEQNVCLDVQLTAVN